jgi:flagellar hook-length control protein FliK
LRGGEDPLLSGINPEEKADQDGLAAGMDDRLRDLKDFRDIAQDIPENAAEAAAKAEAARLTQGKGHSPGVVEKKEKPTAAETRNSRKNRERFTLEVQDLRTGQNGAALNAGQEINPRLEAGAERVTDITVELKDGGGNREFMQGGHEKSAGQAFGDILARELHQNLNGDIVRQASIMVRDGGEGTIRLSLKPEALGMVKIRLEMAENKITGHIIVESDEALRAFEKEIGALEQAFRDSGFEGASLDMALAGDGRQNSGQGQWNREAATPFFPPQFVSSSYDTMGETIELLSLADELNGFESLGMSRVNVLV